MHGLQRAFSGLSVRLKRRGPRASNEAVVSSSMGPEWPWFDIPLVSLDILQVFCPVPLSGAAHEDLLVQDQARLWIITLAVEIKFREKKKMGGMKKWANLERRASVKTVLRYRNTTFLVGSTSRHIYRKPYHRKTQTLQREKVSEVSREVETGHRRM
ncbi:hypothetical protein AJ78_02924 [Emergomyces pasteurianus Ep9510]|uniref:Uncharacterized protein n=1 Tax=Emergomyces pasteurianus Ep9510 TaxID=1447872 RepID=A0A1J9PLG3_9EURO|nr:hypothetical protein AJ78_02924 [Emergomyces pasteurianus Ep9510]